MHDSQIFAKQIRLATLQMIVKANASHIGSCFSLADILAVLYSKVLKYNAKKPKWSGRDRVVLSKGHAAAVFYAALAEAGFFSKKQLRLYCQKGSLLTGHVSSKVKGVEVATGSLGHGLSISCGLALAAKAQKNKARVFCLLSDGELDEGSTLEAALFAPHHRLDNLIAIVDYNKIQSFGHVKDVLNLEPLYDKWRAFNWSVREIDGHNHHQILDVLKNLPFEKNKPSLVIAHTIKGKGVSFMENKLEWHYKTPKEDLYHQALKELEGC